MITKWKVFNFKSIREETELDFGPLTIFAGANSSGKSTFIQSILLVAQTLAHKVGSRSVVLNGALTSLGEFDDLKSNGSESDQITIKCTCQPLSDQDSRLQSQSHRTRRSTIYYRPLIDQFEEIACEISFNADPSGPQRDLFQIRPQLFATSLSCVSRDEDNVDQNADIAIRQSKKTIAEISDVNEIDDKFRAGLDYDVVLDEHSMAEVNEEFLSAEPIGCMLRHFLPERIIYAINPIQEDANAIVQALQVDIRMPVLRRLRRRQFLLSQGIIVVLREVLDGVLDFDEVFKSKYQKELPVDSDSQTITFDVWDNGIRGLPRKDRMKVQQVLGECDDLFDRIHRAMKESASATPHTPPIVTPRLPPLISEATWYLDDFFSSSLKYLGPLRDAPKPLYPIAPTADPDDVGLRGENTASILELHKFNQIKYIPSENFNSPAINRTTVTRSLEAAVVDWLQYLGVASSVKSQDQGKLGHELKVGLSGSDNTHDLTHVGVGVSQVLPILVICLLADTDSTLVFEQPELHLHPKVQTLLGDFFLSMALCNKQCIVETHSEYFIDRLRFRIASDPNGNELNSKSKIYFVEKTSRGSSFQEVKISEYGAISEWPEGFFDQSQQQAEEILRAAAKKRKAGRENFDA